MPVLFCLATLLLGGGCHTFSPLPPADLSTPDWRVHQGQAIWKPTKSRPELAGEIIFATNSNGDFFVSFSKSPFALATAQGNEGRWQIEFGDGKHSWNGRGEPPSRFVWFQLPRAFAGTQPHPPWQWSAAKTNFWRFQNASTGEILEGSFAE